ncbi:hypothetical protein Droror1_Dr00000813 [Drosera rotundifolia]
MASSPHRGSSRLWVTHEKRSTWKLLVELVCSVLGVGSCWISKLVVIIRGLRGAGCSSLTKDRCSSRENISLVPPLLDCCDPSPSSSFPKLGCVRAYWRSKEQLVQLWLGECSHELDGVHRER